MLSYYNRKARLLFKKYQGLDPDSLHANWLRHLPDKPGLALDVGAGSGRDAVWLAQKGWQVIAVEPARALLALGKRATASPLVTWVEDSLPELPKIKAYRETFSLILMSGVLMHLSLPDRLTSMETLAGFMAEKSVLVIILRRGPDTEERDFHKVSPDEIIQFAGQKALQVEVGNTVPDKLGRNGVVWQTIVVKKGIVA